MSLLKQLARVGARPFIVLCLVVAGYYYFAGLEGAIISYSDENRAFHFTLFSPAVYWLCFSLIRILNSFDGAYYTWGMLGFINIFLVFVWTRYFYSTRIAVLAGLFYLFFDLPLSYAKQLYYSTPVITFMLLTIVFMLEAKRRSKTWPLVLAALSTVMLIFLNPSSYAVCIGMLVFLFYLYRSSAICPRQNPLRSILVYIVVTAVSVIIVDALTYTTRGESYLMHLLHYSKLNSAGYTSMKGMQGILMLLNALRDRVFETCSRIFRVAFICCVLMSAFLSRRISRDNKLTLAIAPFVCAAAIFIILAFFKQHVIAYRHLIFLAVPITLVCAVQVESLWCFAKGLYKNLLAVFLVIFFCLNGYACHQITQSMLSISDIEKALDEHGICKTTLATRFYIYRRKDVANGIAPIETPAFMYTARNEPGKPKSRPWVHWTKLYERYRDDNIRYFLSSGYGDVSGLGDNDPALSGVTLLASWPHPISNKYIHLYPENVSVKLYDLKDVFKK